MNLLSLCIVFIIPINRIGPSVPERARRRSNPRPHRTCPSLPPDMLVFSRLSVIFVLTAGLLACAPSEPTTGDEQEKESSPNRLVVEDLSAPVGGLTAYDLIKHYKSNWLQKQGTNSIQNSPDIQVYLNNSGSQLESVSSLRSINAENVSVIEYYPPNEAQFKFGLGNSIGAILVHTKSGS